MKSPAFNKKTVAVIIAALFLINPAQLLAPAERSSLLGQVHTDTGILNLNRQSITQKIVIGAREAYRKFFNTNPKKTTLAVQTTKGPTTVTPKIGPPKTPQTGKLTQDNPTTTPVITTGPIAEPDIIGLTNSATVNTILQSADLAQFMDTLIKTNPNANLTDLATHYNKLTSPNQNQNNAYKQIAQTLKVIDPLSYDPIQQANARAFLENGILKTKPEEFLAIKKEANNVFKRSGDFIVTYAALKEQPTIITNLTSLIENCKTLKAPGTYTGTFADQTAAIKRQNIEDTRKNLSQPSFSKKTLLDTITTNEKNLKDMFDNINAIDYALQIPESIRIVQNPTLTDFNLKSLKTMITSSQNGIDSNNLGKVQEFFNQAPKSTGSGVYATTTLDQLSRSSIV